MDGVFFLMSVMGVALVMHWMVVNDRVAPDQPTTGLFAMLERAGRRKPGARTWRAPAQGGVTQGGTDTPSSVSKRAATPP